jgi:predicted amidophosphoribosyltransferase
LRAGSGAAIRGKWPILVDDVVTTGSTLVACAKVLYEAGAIAVSALTVARER